MLLAIASYFEKYITDLLKEFFTIQSNNNPLLLDYIIRTTLDRKISHIIYMGCWQKSGINPLMKIFGEDFKKRFDELIRSDKDLESAYLGVFRTWQQTQRISA
ncbi:MAG UNVERIFIED_CONTAM: hypothetical protein LVT10_01640 [Anaerolineae bacterium]